MTTTHAPPCTQPQMHGLSPEVLKRMGPLLVEDLSDYYVRAVRRAILEYRRCACSLCVAGCVATWTAVIGRNV
eukprot:360751-Chlamydomonas_euryale.AAC.1